MIEMDFKNEIVRSVPPVVVSGFTLFGVSLNEWVIILTIVYIFIQCLSLTFRIHRDQCVFKYKMGTLYGRRKEDKKISPTCSIYNITDEDIKNE